MFTVDAPAKINLALHVIGRRADGYHLIESLVAFTKLGDQVSAGLADEDSLQVVGPEAGALSRQAASANLVIRARDALRHAARAAGRAAPAVRLRLDKRLPVASGIGGGSADAAATLRLLGQVWEFQPDAGTLAQIALGLGADVPMCLKARSLIASGIGETLEPVDFGFALDLVVVNPRIGISTPTVFSALQTPENPPLPSPERFGDRAELTAWLAGTRNDLEPSARQMVPDISTCLAALAGTGAGFARMSGSGASCFGIYDSGPKARDAAAVLELAHPGWFVAATRTLSAEKIAENAAPPV